MIQLYILDYYGYLQNKGLNNIFIFCSMNDPNHEEIGAYEDLLKELDSGTGVLVTCPVINKATRQYGVLT